MAKLSNVRKRKEMVSGYLFVAPSAILLLTFMVLPILISFFLSFTKFNGFQIPTFLGIENYAKLFKDKDFAAAMKNTIIFVLVTVPLQTAFALAIAAVIAAKFRNPFGEFIRGTLFIPVLCSAALVGSVFYYLFASDSEATINMLLAMFGMDKVNWLGKRATSLAVICLVTVWKNVGYFLVIFYASIMDVPRSYYEAARIDGASNMQQFWHITLPGIKSVLFLVITLGTIWAFQVFDLTFVMTKGGPGNATMSPVLEIYNQGFLNHTMGYASAIAVVLSLVIFAVTIIQRKLFGEKAGGADV